jgi:ABC-type cobalamin transport system permease subunit
MKNLKTRFRLSRSLTAILIGAVASLALASATMFALGGFTATIANTGPGFASGTVVLQEAVGGSSTTCLSTAADQITTNSNNCTTINI